MPFINLIQEKRLAARAKEQQVRVGLGVTLCVGVVSLLGAAALMFDATRLNIKASALEQKQRELEPLVKELEFNQSEIEKLQPRIKTLGEAQGFSARWGRVLAHLTANTPPETWLTSVKAYQQDKTTPLALTFNGVSLSNEMVGVLILRLEASEDLENVKLKFTQPKFVEGAENQLEFEIQADMTGTSEAVDGPKETA